MKDFIIIGNANAAISKNVFPLFKDGKARFGYSKRGMDFDTDEGVKNINAVWYVTFPVKRKPLTLTQRYSPAKYPKYDNYDAIEVSKVKDIPYDYEGVMGVPVTILDYDLSQFGIVGLDRYVEDNPHYGHRFTINNKETYARILIRKVQFEIVGVLYGEYTEIDGEYIKGHMPFLNGKPKYSRLLIKRK